MNRPDTQNVFNLKAISSNHLNWWIILIIFFYFVWIYYILAAGRNVIYTDQYRIVPMIANDYFKNTLNFSSLWSAHLEHRVLGYNLLVLSNIVVFNYNTLLEMYLSVLVLIATICLVLYFLLDSNAIHNHTFSFHLSVASIILGVLSLSQADIVVWSIGVGIFILNLLFISTILCIENYLYKHSASFIVFLAALLYSVNIICFSGGYGTIQALSILCVLLLLLALKQCKKQVVFCLIMFLIASLISLGTYYYKLNIEHLDRLEHGIDVLGVLKFFFYALGNAFLGNATISAYGLDHAVLLFGLLYFIVMIWILSDYLLYRHYNYFMWPVVLIYFSALGILLIGVARVPLFDAYYGLQPRYISTSMLGIVGISSYRIYRHTYFRFSGTFFHTSISIWLFVFIVFQIFNSSLELRIAPYRGLYFDQLQDKMVRILCNDNELPDSFFSPFNAFNPDEVRNAVVTLAEHRISFFKDWKPGSDLNSAILHKGWHGEEHGGRWISKEALFTLGSTDTFDSLVVAGHIPNGDGFHRLRIFSGRDVLYDAMVSGSISIEVPISPRKMIHGSITLDRFVSQKPPQGQPNEDERGMLVTRLEVATSRPLPAPPAPHVDEIGP
uniref:Uncharacterized protein n=1 Tax=Desulfatirhabdium butyrativorans TaxID=340467 RepID=A0A7C4VRG3_9BACT